MDSFFVKEEILKILGSCISDINEISKNHDEDISHYGMDSLMFVRIVVILENVFETEIPDEYLTITKMNSVNKMSRVILMSIKQSNS